MARRNLADEWPPLTSLTALALRRWNLRLSCPSCRHERVLSGAGLWWLFHRRRWDDDLSQAPSRFFCTRCSLSSPRKVLPLIARTRDSPTGDPLPDPDMHEWKRLIARYRS